MKTPIDRLDQTVERLSKLRSVPLDVRARLEEAAFITAEKISPAVQKKMEREAKKRKKPKVWVEVTSQPTKSKGRWVGRATFQRRGEDDKHSQMISLSGPAKLSIKSKKLWVKPKKGTGYFWADPDEEKKEAKEEEAKDKAQESVDLAPPYADVDGDGVQDNSRVGVPADVVPVPPAIPRLANLTEEERAVEGRFADAFEKEPDLIAQLYADKVMQIAKDKGEPPKFVTDDTKVLTPDYNPSGKSAEEIAAQRARNNTLLHQTANAVAKRAFLKHLDELAKLDDDDPKKSVLVTSGGCGAGKGFALKKGPDDVKNSVAGVGAIWDAAGEQNATENPWIMEECRKRGIKGKFLFVDSDPNMTWNGPWGVVQRANPDVDENGNLKNEGRMVDARLFADSYAHGAKNMKAFMDANKGKDDVEFVILNNRGKPPPKVEKEIGSAALNLNADSLYKKAFAEVEETAPTDAIREGATRGKRLWEDDGGSKKAASASEWLSQAGFLIAEDEVAEEEDEAEEPAEDGSEAVSPEDKVVEPDEEPPEGDPKPLDEALRDNLAANMENWQDYERRRAEERAVIAENTLGMDDEGNLTMPSKAEEPPEGDVAARMDDVAERLSALKLPTPVMLAVEAAADAVVSANRYAARLRKAPREVREVFEAMMENANLALDPVLAEQAIYLRDPTGDRDGGEWSLSDNFERFNATILDYDPNTDQWSKRRSYGSGSKDISHRDAMQIAETFFGPPKPQEKQRKPGEVLVHEYPSTGAAYGASQTDEEIKDGDLLLVKKGGRAVALAILMQAWPTLVAGEDDGGFDKLRPDAPFPEGGVRGKYKKSLKLASEVARKNRLQPFGVVLEK